MAWTKDQEKAINITGRNVLVSAAAGSGKTAVLTERVVSRIIKGKTEADRVVVVTFTKAAAAEMKERIRNELQKALLEEPDNKRIFIQMTLLQDAFITTIDSFCQSIIRTHFEEAGLEPDFRVAETGEIKLLQSDVFDEVIEKFYEENSEDFYELIKAFGGKKNDEDIERIITEISDEALNNPWPYEWLDNLMKSYEITDITDIDENPIINSLFSTVKLRLKTYEYELEKSKEFLTEETGLAPYFDAADDDINKLHVAVESKNYEEIKSSLNVEKWTTLGKVKSEECDIALKDKFSALRTEYKKFFKKYADIFARITVSENGVISETKNTGRFIKQMLLITKEYLKTLEIRKRERGIITFNDMEHLALKVLVHRENEVSTLTSAAKDMRDYYDEILIDEYQDSNMLQEEILSAISNGHNRYMVGDVKQSIYGFRKARPDIFIKKYDSYEADDTKENCKIILQNNFRSRKQLLDGINVIFSRVIKKDFSGIGYGTEEALVAGFDFPEPTPLQKTFHGEAGKTCFEFIVSEEDERRDKRRLEAELIAMRINELISEGYMIFDKKENKYRTISYRDIVILSRKGNIFDDTKEALTKTGISAYAESNESYLETYELRPVISFLRVIDNPLDDIALASVMLSYFGNFSVDELAIIRTEDKYKFLFNNLEEYIKEDGDENKLKEKASDFCKYINDLRKLASESSVYDLIWNLIYDSGYYRYVSSMDLAEKRLANISLFLNRAAAFSGTSYNGLFQFLRYIEKIKESGEEAGEVSALSENDDVVRIMTIHKSKGLEFPVVFLMGMTGLFRLTDDKESVVCHDELGIAVSDINLKRKTKKKTIFKTSIIERINRDEISEELRLLYVAMTRAREKLFLVGASESESPDKYIKKTLGKDYSVNDLYKLKTYFDCCMAAATDTENNSLFELRTTKSSDIEIISPENKEVYSQKEEKYDEFLKTKIPYSFENEINKKPKVSVTELKNGYRLYDEEHLEENHAYEAEFINSISKIENKNKKDMPSSAAHIGSAYHKLMECINYNESDTLQKIEAQIDKLVKIGLIDSEAAKEIKTESIMDYLASDLGQRACKADKEGRLFREREFMIGIKQKDMTDLLIVQGVIDMYIEDDDGISIIDYKTDRVNKKKGENVLKERYKEQLNYYAIALEQATGKKTKEKIIYSFDLGKEIYL